MPTKQRRIKEVPHGIVVKVLPLGGTTQEVALAQNSTVQEALAAAHFSWDSRTEARINGDVVEKDTIVEDGEFIIVSSAGKIEGGL